MIQAVSQKRFPADYRLLASGYLPNYLYDLHALDHRWDMQTWYQRAHINPRVENLKDIHSQDFSTTHSTRRAARFLSKHQHALFASDLSKQSAALTYFGHFAQIQSIQIENHTISWKKLQQTYKFN